MKFTKIISALTICLFTFVAIAQPSPKDIAAQQTRIMIGNLGLSDAQLEQVKQINLDYVIGMEQVRSQGIAEPTQLQTAIQTIEEARDSKLLTLLDSEQFNGWNQIKEGWKAAREEARASAIAEEKIKAAAISDEELINE